MGEPAGGEFSMFEHRTVACLYFIFGILGILGNLIVVFIFCREKPLSGTRGKMHIQLAITNIMVVAGCPFSGSSAFAGRFQEHLDSDFQCREEMRRLRSLFKTLWAARANALHPFVTSFRWLFGHVGCQLYGLETYTGGMGAVSFVFLVCLQRLLCTKCPDYYNTSRVSTSLSLIGWLYSIGIAVGPLVGWNSYTIESSSTACGLNWEKDDWSHRSMFIALPVITCIKIIVCVYSLKVAFAGTGIESKSERNREDWFTDSNLNWIALSSLVIVCIGFGPYGFFSVWSLFNHSSQMTMVASVIPPLMAKMSCMFYPIAYLVASPKFRQEYLSRLIGTCVCKQD